MAKLFNPPPHVPRQAVDGSTPPEGKPTPDLEAAPAGWAPWNEDPNPAHPQNHRPPLPVASRSFQETFIPWHKKPSAHQNTTQQGSAHPATAQKDTAPRIPWAKQAQKPPAIVAGQAAPGQALIAHERLAPTTATLASLTSPSNIPLTASFPPEQAKVQQHKAFSL